MWEDEVVIRILNNDVYLDEYCWKCIKDDASGFNPDPECSECKGSGFILTTNGQAIFDLMNRHNKGDKS